MKVHFGLDAKDIVSRVKASRITVAWLAAKTRSEKQADMDGECEVRKVPKDIGLSDMAAMRTAYEKMYWPLEDNATPARPASVGRGLNDSLLAEYALYINRNWRAAL